MNAEKPFTEKSVSLWNAASTSSTKDDNLHTICKCDFNNYIAKREWIQCITCMNCKSGIFDKRSKKKQYEYEGRWWWLK